MRRIEELAKVIHAGQAVKEILTTEPKVKRLFLYRIPLYSPELNSTEQLWLLIIYISIK